MSIRATSYSFVSRETIVKAVVLRGGCDDKVRVRESMARLAALPDQEAPLEHDVLGYCQYSLE